MVATVRPQSSAGAPVTDAGLVALLGSFEGISLEALGEDNLQNRLDTKFLLGLRTLPAMLETLVPYYRVLEVAGVRLLGYQTLYFDTPGFGLYLAQHAGRTDRYKVRSRRYVETQGTFLEVKHKNGNSRTVKNRIATGTLLTELDADVKSFVATHLPANFDAATLEPKLWNRFSRISLVARNGRERVTIDVDLGYGRELIAVVLPGVVVAEMKQDRADPGSPFLQLMRANGVRPTGFSKYCIGAALLNPALKHNRFKQELRRAQQISERYVNHE